MSTGNAMQRGNSRPPGLRGRGIGMYYKKLSQIRKREQGEEERIRLGPSVVVPSQVLTRIDECLHNFFQQRVDGQISNEFEKQFRHLLSVNFEEFIAEAMSGGSDFNNNDVLNKRFISELLQKENTDEFKRRYQQRMLLPAMKQHKRILNTVDENQVLLIVGSTGCGKTTQVAQMLLDMYIYSNRGSQCRIVCTQPRRISAVSVAERVAYERCEEVGGSVGYQIRMESKMPREYGSILYCTTGILLQKMLSDPLMKGLSTIILDEIHERSVETDLLMGLLKKILPHRPELKVILMSATVSEEDFCQYFDNCCTLRIEGTLFPVKVYYLEDILQETGYSKFQNMPQETTHQRKQRQERSRNVDRSCQYSTVIEPYLRQLRYQYDAQVIQAMRCSDSEGCENLQFIEFLIFYICEHKPPGAILVFLPGYERISKLHSVLQKPTLPIGQRFQQKIQVYPLHSMMPTMYQQSVFQPPPPGKRKIILATIIAETSVTIDDVVYVINTGRTKICSYNIESNVQTLEETWVTKANSQQRKGRAGRVQPGICYNLFSRARERVMKEVPTPEILRCKLESIILNMKMLHIADVFEFFKTLINAPEAAAIKNGIGLLKRIDALDNAGNLTPLGVHLARLPIDPQIGKMILMGALFRCLDPITSVAAGVSFKSPFYTPLGQEQKVDRVKRELSVDTKSDHLLIDNVLLSYREAVEDCSERDFCFKNYLSITTLKQLYNMKQQFAELLKAVSFIESSRFDNKSSNVNSNNISLLRAIIAAGLYPNMAHLRYFVYFQKQKSSALYILDSTMVFPMALLIFGDSVETGRMPDNQFYISVARSYYFKCNLVTADIILKVRRELEWLMRKKALYPSPIAPSSGDEYLIKAIQILLSLDEVVEDYEDQYPPSDGDEDFFNP